LNKGDHPHTWKPWEVGSSPFKRWLNSHRETMCKMLLHLTHIVLLHKINVFLHFIWRGYFSWSEWFSHFKTLSDHKYSFHKLTQFSQGNKVLEPPASNIDGFLIRDKVFLPFTWKELICTIVKFLMLENPERKAVFLSKANSILTWKQCARPSCF
jgi:hypothetical protein